MIINFMKHIFGDSNKPVEAAVDETDTYFSGYYLHNFSPMRLVVVEDFHDYVSSTESPVYRAGDVVLYVDRQEVIDRLKKSGYRVVLEHKIGPNFDPTVRCELLKNKRLVQLERSADLGGRNQYNVSILESDGTRWTSDITVTIERTAKQDEMLAAALALVGSAKTKFECNLASPEPLMDRIRFSEDITKLPFFKEFDTHLVYRLMCAIRNIKASAHDSGRIGMAGYLKNAKSRGAKAQSFMKQVVETTGASEEDVIKACFLADITYIGTGLKFVDTSFSEDHVQKVIDLYKIGYVFSC